ncbi:MAG TPA: hypothetical protein VJJ98_05700 [Sedimentisphaerales bacterium]|nr:hypothetical protein [Sedimentisphaerales bacterium]
MAFEIRILSEFDIIELRLEGIVNVEEFLEARSQICSLCEQHGPLNALLDMREMQFGISTTRIYEFASRIKHPIGVGIALLCRPNDSDARFFETVAINNGVQIRLFTEYSEALAFLTG